MASPFHRNAYSQACNHHEGDSIIGIMACLFRRNSITGVIALARAVRKKQTVSALRLECSSSVNSCCSDRNSISTLHLMNTDNIRNAGVDHHWHRGPRATGCARATSPALGSSAALASRPICSTGTVAGACVSISITADIVPSGSNDRPQETHHDD